MGDEIKAAAGSDINLTKEQERAAWKRIQKRIRQTPRTRKIPWRKAIIAAAITGAVVVLSVAGATAGRSIVSWFEGMVQNVTIMFTKPAQIDTTDGIPAERVYEELSGKAPLSLPPT